MIAWLASSEEVEFLSQGETPTFVTVDARLVFDAAVPGYTWWWNTVPRTDALTCVPPEIIGALSRVGTISPCDTSVKTSVGNQPAHFGAAVLSHAQALGEPCVMKNQNVRPQVIRSLTETVRADLEFDLDLSPLGFFYQVPRPSSLGISRSAAVIFQGNANCRITLRGSDKLLPVFLLSDGKPTKVSSIEAQVGNADNIGLLYDVDRHNSGQNERSLYAYKSVELRNPLTGSIDKNPVLSKPRIQLEVCTHEENGTRCFSGDSEFQTGQKVILQEGLMAW